MAVDLPLHMLILLPLLAIPVQELGVTRPWRREAPAGALVLTALLFHFDFELPPGISPEDMDMIEKSGISMESKAKLFVVAVPRVPVPPAHFQ
uniref:Uncharacterized protein n=1 Tax=Leersia perrieri TaxID=77586 RepID=A0A0D9VD35_9ORYZ